MQSVKVDAVVKLSCRDAFRAVSSFENYSELTSMIEKSSIDPKTGHVRLDFNMNSTLGALLARFSNGKTFQISQTAVIPDHEITATGIDGPLSKFNIRYGFEPVEDATLVRLRIDFETGKGFLIDLGAKLALQSIAGQMVEDLKPKLETILKKMTPTAA